MLNANELMGVITNFDDENVQQVGIDLNVVKISKLQGTGVIKKTGKALPEYKEIPPKSIDMDGNEPEIIGWRLLPGVYYVTFQQGCKIPDNIGFQIIQRSTVMRCGTIINSSEFDPGFETSQMGTMIFVFSQIVIEFGSRIGQVIAHECNPTTKYAGQYQNDNQRK